MYQDRAAFILQLDTFITSTNEDFDHLLQTLNWTKDSLLSSKEVDNNHKIPEKDESVFFDQNESFHGGTTDQGQVNVLDVNGNWLQTISFLQRKSEPGGSGQLYNEIVASLQAGEQTIKNDKSADKAATLAQLLQIERDSKRRRISYKNKVHTKNKSHTEVLREVLVEQMLTLSAVQDDRTTSAGLDNPPHLAPKQTTELITVWPPQGNPHLAWKSILDEAEDEGKSRTSHSSRSLALKSDQSKHRRQSPDRRQRFKGEEDVYRKESRRDSSSKEWRIKEEKDDRYRDKDKRRKNGRDEESENVKDDSLIKEKKHHKKKKRKRSRSGSPQSEYSDHKKHKKSKHKKRKH